MSVELNVSEPAVARTRAETYYWKCDRASGLHNLGVANEGMTGEKLSQLQSFLRQIFPDFDLLTPAGGKGNHFTYLLEESGRRHFVRVEDGPERDAHIDVESSLLGAVAATGVPVPRVIFSDGTRRRVPFAVQVIEYFDCPDLNKLHRENKLPLREIAKKIGRAIALWQSVPVTNFGPFDPDLVPGRLRGYHTSYEAYFRLHLERHLQVLLADEFVSGTEAEAIRLVIEANTGLFRIDAGCLVHKDLALWNIMGTTAGIRAFIDWDDAISGDPTDDLSLLACFHPHAIVQAAIEGYESVRPLPDRFLQRFWLHLLRNMIVKAVIRCGAGYFRQTGGAAFLMEPGQSGEAFRAFTRERVLTALLGLKGERGLDDL